MTHAVTERGGDTVFLKSLGFGLHLRIKNGQHGLMDQMQGKDILPTNYAFIWHCQENNQVWVEDHEGHIGVFDLIDRSWVAPLEFSQVFPYFQNPYVFTVVKNGRRGQYDALKKVLAWDN